MTRDIAASVRQRLLNVSRQRGDDFQYVMTRYGLERLLYRLTQSPHASQFVLKGAALFELWTEQPHRSTRDLDLLGEGAPATERFEQLFRDICRAPVEEDGLSFDPHSISAEQIKEEDEYQGIRVRLLARLQAARIPLQVDVGFGDAITPQSQTVTFPTLLDFPPPRIAAYPRENGRRGKVSGDGHAGNRQ